MDRVADQLEREVVTKIRDDVAALKAAHEKRLEERSEALHDKLHGALSDHPDTFVVLDCGCEWVCVDWERGRADSYATAKLYPVAPGYVVECPEHE